MPSLWDLRHFCTLSQRLRAGLLKFRPLCGLYELLTVLNPRLELSVELFNNPLSPTNTEIDAGISREPHPKLVSFCAENL